MNNVIVYIIFVLIVTILVMTITLKSTNNKGMVYMKSDIDGELYLVRNKSDKRQAANMLASIKRDIMTLSEHLNNNINDKEYIEYKSYIEQLERNLIDAEIRESNENTVHTSYTVNKGEKVVFCLRSKEITRYIKNSNMHNRNVVMYVALHEIAHVACPEFGHTPLFMKIFRFFTLKAIDIGIYQKIDFKSNPKEYCGMTIDESIV